MAQRYKPSMAEYKKYQRRIQNVGNIRNELRGYKSATKVIAKKLKSATYEEIRKPDLVLPKSRRMKKTFESREDFLKQMDELRKYTSIKRYFKMNYKDKILELLRADMSRQVEKVDENWNDKWGEFEPASDRGKYTAEQKAEFPELSDWMTMYNKMVDMSISNFMAFYAQGYIPEYQFIYDEIERLGNRGSRDSRQDIRLETLQTNYSLFFNKGGSK